MSTDLVYIAVWLFIAAILIHKFIFPQALSSSKKYRTRQAKRALSTLKSIESPAMRFAYLRKMNPYVFEEMINESIKMRGLVVTKTATYSGDGGIDGTFFIGSQRFLIQAKRYKNHIDPKHVNALSRLCEQKSCLGIFVHTGKTGPKSKDMAKSNVAFISGSDLLSLFNQDQITLKIGQHNFAI